MEQSISALVTLSGAGLRESETTRSETTL